MVVDCQRLDHSKRLIGQRFDVDTPSRLAEGHKVAGNLLNALSSFCRASLEMYYLSNVIDYLSNVIYYLSNVIGVHYLIPARGEPWLCNSTGTYRLSAKRFGRICVPGLIPERPQPARVSETPHAQPERHRGLFGPASRCTVCCWGGQCLPESSTDL